MKYIEVRIKCNTEEYSEVLADAGIEQECVFRDGIIFIDKISSIYRTENKIHCFVELTELQTLHISNSLEEVVTQISSIS